MGAAKFSMRTYLTADRIKVDLYKVLLWLPRVITILFTLFLSLFALDSFSEQTGFSQATLNFLIHLIPSFLMILLLVFSWNREWIGAVFFMMLGIFRLISAWGNFPYYVELLIAGPFFLISLLFLFNWIRKRKLYKGSLNG
jgi:uncharacterized protein (DUF983 family)